jgi:hypothetical protein
VYIATPARYAVFDIHLSSKVCLQNRALTTYAGNHHVRPSLPGGPCLDFGIKIDLAFGVLGAFGACGRSFLRGRGARERVGGSLQGERDDDAERVGSEAGRRTTRVTTVGAGFLPSFESGGDKLEGIDAVTLVEEDGVGVVFGAAEVCREVVKKEDSDWRTDVEEPPYPVNAGDEKLRAICWDRYLALSSRDFGREPEARCRRQLDRFFQHRK